MELPTVEVSPLDGKQVSGLKFKSTEKLEKLQRIGFKILLLGMTPEKYMGKFSIHHAILFSTLIIFHTFYACYEATATLFFCHGLLEQLSHGYIATYLFAFNSQWYFMLMNIRQFHVGELQLESFESTKAFPEFAESVLDKNVTTLEIVLALSITWWFTNSMTHIIGPSIEALLSFVRYGKMTDNMFILPPVFMTPWWAQIITYVCNAITMFGLVLYCAASYTIMGSRVLKLKTQCDILNEALKNDIEDEPHIKVYIRDHQELIKHGKQLNDQLAVLNGFMFTACYLEFAVQMFALTLIDPNGAYYFAMAFDLLSIFLILAFQCWMGSIITHSLIRRSYAMYTFLMIFQDK